MMAYKAFATNEEICQVLCHQKVGTQIHIIRNVQLNTGIIEQGTMLVIRKVTLRDDAKIPKIYKDELSGYCADSGLFAYELYDPASKQRLNCTGDHIESSLRWVDYAAFWGFLLIPVIVIAAILLWLHYNSISTEIELCLAVLIFAYVVFMCTEVLKDIEQQKRWIWKRNSAIGKVKQRFSKMR